MTRRFAMELVREGRSEQEYDSLPKNVSERSMVGRTGDPDDIANAVAFLASPASGFITAQILTVDGGRMDYIGHS